MSYSQPDSGTGFLMGVIIFIALLALAAFYWGDDLLDRFSAPVAEPSGEEELFSSAERYEFRAEYYGQLDLLEDRIFDFELDMLLLEAESKARAQIELNTLRSDLAHLVIRLDEAEDVSDAEWLVLKAEVQVSYDQLFRAFQDFATKLGAGFQALGLLADFRSSSHERLKYVRDFD